MLIGYNYWDQYGYCYGVQNQLNDLITKYSNIYYDIEEIDILYTPIEILNLHKMKEVDIIYHITEIEYLYTVSLI